jgi:dCTP diphosphatase
MTDETATLRELRDHVQAFARERDWEQFHSPKNLSMALAAEAGELMEHFLWLESEASRAIDARPGLRREVEDELADVVIYALEFANICGTDLASAIARKLAANALKYPVEKARGRAEKYTEL